MENVRTRKAFRQGKHSDLGAQCVSVYDPSSFNPRAESEIYPKEMTRLHCLRYGKYFTLKEKCLRCRYMLSFTQEAR